MTQTEIQTAVAAMTFEEAMARLEQVVRLLEGNAVSLDESLSLYEEGVALVRRCQGQLNEVEQRVKILQKAPDGEIRPADFATTAD